MNIKKTKNDLIHKLLEKEGETYRQALVSPNFFPRKYALKKKKKKIELYNNNIKN